MPRKIRQLKSEYRKLGYVEQAGHGKGSHSKWTHPLLPGVTVILSGHDGDDAQPYQERDLRNVIAKLKELS
jgi:predicted RNA binding protein YcfA (HicA-like mRNA interferase family)